MHLRHAQIAVTALLLAFITVLVPIGLSTNLRWAYEQTLANWRSKIIAPNRVFLGDSLVAGGGDFGHFGTINLGITGALAVQMEGWLPIARAYNPKHIIVMAGLNDIALGYDDPSNLAKRWRAILLDKRVVIVLVPHTRDPKINGRIDLYNRMLADMAKASGRTVVNIPGITGTDGLRLPEMTNDGAHLTPAAYVHWSDALDAVIE